MNYIIDFVNTATNEQIDNYLQSQSISVVKVFNNFEKIYVVSCATEPIKNELVESVIEDSVNAIKLLDVSFTELSTSSDQIVLNDDNDWWKVAVFSEVDWEQSIQISNRRGSKVTVYLLDSGIKLDHPEFTNTDVSSAWSFNNDHTDNRGHGTALSSIIVGNTCGITNAKLKSVKIFDSNQPTLQSDLLGAFDYVITDFTNNNRSPSIVNLSWSISRNSYVESKIDILRNLGIYVVCAAGNNGTPIQDVTPAAMTNIFKIGAYNQDLAPCDFSNYIGSSFLNTTPSQVNSLTVDDTYIHHFFGWAPGEKIRAAKLDDGTGMLYGTSAASAIATACLAYNTSMFVTEDGNPVISVVGVDLSPVFHSLFERQDILEMGTQYASTYNGIVTIHNRSLVDIYQQYNNQSEFIIFAKYGSYIKGILYDKNIYNQITYDSLPTGLSIDNAIIYGTVENLTNVDQEKFIVNARLEGPNVDPKIITITINAFKTVQSIGVGYNYSANDPTLTIQLLDDFCCQFTSFCQLLAGADCQATANDFCGTGTRTFGSCRGTSKNACGCFGQCANRAQSGRLCG